MADPAGWDPDGIGTPGLIATASFQVVGFSIARSAGDSILHLRYTERRSFTEATGVVRMSSLNSIILMDMGSNRVAAFAALLADSTGVGASTAVDSVGPAEAGTAKGSLTNWI